MNLVNCDGCSCSGQYSKIHCSGNSRTAQEKAKNIIVLCATPLQILLRCKDELKFQDISCRNKIKLQNSCIMSLVTTKCGQVRISSSPQICARIIIIVGTFSRNDISG